MVRIGHGFDVHAFAATRKLILGGVEISHYQGLLGHSDADVAIHALCDALLGSLALGDIGNYFPDTEASYKNVDSRSLLRQVNGLLYKHGYQVNNADLTIVAQAPKLAPYIASMRKNLAADLATSIDKISIKATSTECLGYIGREEGIAAHAVVTVVKLK